MGEQKADSGSVKWGVTITPPYLPDENHDYFTNNLSLVDWLRQYTKTEEERDETFVRGF